MCFPDQRDATISADRQSTTNDRLDELESRLLFQEDHLNTLNDVLAAQDMRMAELVRQVKQLEQQLKQNAGFAGGGDGLADEPPPHY